MTREQVAEAQRRAREWEPTPPSWDVPSEPTDLDESAEEQTSEPDPSAGDGGRDETRTGYEHSSTGVQQDTGFSAAGERVVNRGLESIGPWAVLSAIAAVVAVVYWLVVGRGKAQGPGEK